MARRIVDIATNDGVYKSTTFPQSVLDSMRTNVYVGDRPTIAGSNISQIGTIIASQTIPTKTTTSTNGKIIFYSVNNGSSGECYIDVDNYRWNMYASSYGSYNFQAFFSCVIDDETELGWIICGFQYTQSGNTDYYIYYQMGNNTCYNAIIGNEPVLYQWSSVTAISGKNGILSLPVLIDTDGNPVSNGSASDFSTLPDSVKVRTLADLAVQ